ncbi:MAG TPA: heat-inducible transcriptional repressor HrcA [Rhodothermales bacterium]|nr:heat-inducible transcriptional repressor HrcA [Rhodothermales bacterium]
MRTSGSSYRPEHALSEREQEILRLVVRSFIDTAGPVGSRYLARHYPIGLSPASIRNTMSDLEELGYLGHPYTSAGRMPTEMGYRAFVDELMASPELSVAEKKLLKAQLDQIMGDTEELLRESSRLLGQMSNLLGVVLSPRLSKGVLERLDVVPLASSRVMVVISVRGGFVKTIVLEVEATFKRRDLDRIVSMLNERLAGLRLEEIRHSFAKRTRDLDDEGTGIVRLILNESTSLFSEPTEGRMTYSGTQQIITQPEFQEMADVRNLIEIIENEGYVVQLLEGQHPEFPRRPGKAVVSIGSENSDERADKYSIVTAHYQVGETTGTVGILGPMRMDYERVVALVENMATLLSHPGATS